MKGEITTVEIDRPTHEQLREMAAKTGLKIGRLATLILRQGLTDFPKAFPGLFGRPTRVDVVGQDV